MFIEQGNLFNSINFNLAPETPGMAGDVPFMPPFMNANRENATASRTQVAAFLCPSDAADFVPDWPGGNSYLGNMQTWACDLGENNPSTVAPGGEAAGHLLLPERRQGRGDHRRHEQHRLLQREAARLRACAIPTPAPTR